MTGPPVSLSDIEAAARRIAGRVRRTPTIAAAPLAAPPGPFELFLKLENLQVTGSFKPRGATNCLLQLDPALVARGVITASGGNHGLAVAYAARRAGAPAVIYLPAGTPRDKAERLAALGAEVAIEGAVWDEANRAALARAERDGLAYLHPFADPRVIAGQGTVGLEILADAPEIDHVIVAIGGGGLISGVATAVKALEASIRVSGVEPVGAPTLTRSLEAGAPVALPEIATAAGTLAPARSEAINLEIVARAGDETVLVADEARRAAARWLWAELGSAAELSGAAAMAALLQGRLDVAPGARVCALVCGAGRDGLD
ncbi:MAG: threonine/serine dehydratase [Kiloniellales bacterium]|nr:threonine/serine dehydratase [Kiloniellales bacterium]